MRKFQKLITLKLINQADFQLKTNRTLENTSSEMKSVNENRPLENRFGAYQYNILRGYRNQKPRLLSVVVRDKYKLVCWLQRVVKGLSLVDKVVQFFIYSFNFNIQLPVRVPLYTHFVHISYKSMSLFVRKIFFHLL